MKRNKKCGFVVGIFACLVIAVTGLTLNGCSSTSDSGDSGGGSSDGGNGGGNGGDSGGSTTFALTSTDITSGGTIGSTYALADCNGSNTSPQLSWSGDLPTGSLALAVTVLDTSASNFVHWLVYDIPTTVTSIAQAASAADIGITVAFGPNDYAGNLQQYDGPCPPAGETHTYEFKVWGLDTVDLTTDTTVTFTNPASVVSGISSHSLGTASFTATFTAP